tara:strand:+ start:2503 stop:3726 length:1224 start_codon:yes stop_codon:yes gene_type:complete
MKYSDLKETPQEGDIVGLEFGDVMIEGKFVEYLDDGIVLEVNNKGERLLKEFLPLIPAAVWAGGAAWSAYDAWQAKKAYDRGEITKGDLAKKIGTDAALTIIGGGLAKGAVKATKAISKAFKKKPEVKVDAPKVEPAKVNNTPVAKTNNAPVAKTNNAPITKNNMPAAGGAAAVAGTGGTVATKKISKKIDNKKKNKNKKKSRFGFTGPNATMGSNLSGFVDKYGFGAGQPVNASVQEKDEPSLKGFDAKTQAEIVKLKARYPQAENLLSALLADVAASKSSGQNTDHRQDVKFKDLEKRLYDLEQKLNSKVTEELTEAEYQGRKVKLGKPMRGDVKKFKVYVKDPKTGNVKKVNFGHGGTSAKKKGEKTMKIKKSDPARRKSFRARHNCDNPGPRTKARYWSCRAW